VKLGLVSDSHGDVESLRALLAGPFADCDLVLHAGDVLYHGPRNPLPPSYAPAELAEVINTSPVPFVLARGNCDADVDQLVLDAPLLTPLAVVQWQDVRVVVNHGDRWSQAEGAAEAARLKARYLVFGHIHTPVLERRDGVVLVNPGSCALPKFELDGVPVPTYGLITDSGAEIRRLDTHEVLLKEPG